ncbi:hypothetical protein KM043_016834 [Ampulex compressa]|nr:hypothetical protein KM043_016834 [Ampulex compressa]
MTVPGLSEISTTLSFSGSLCAQHSHINPTDQSTKAKQVPSFTVTSRYHLKGRFTLHRRHEPKPGSPTIDELCPVHTGRDARAAGGLIKLDEPQESAGEKSRGRRNDSGVERQGEDCKASRRWSALDLASLKRHGIAMRLPKSCYQWLTGKTGRTMENELPENRVRGASA